MTSAAAPSPSGAVAGHPTAGCRRVLLALAALEARRMLRHPAPWCGLALSGWWAVETFELTWSGAAYTGLLAACMPLLLGVSLASVSAFARVLAPLAEEAVTEKPRRVAAVFLGGLALVGLVAVVVAGGSAALRLTGGLVLGDEPGRTSHAHHTLPELLQPVLLACLAVALGAAVVRILRQRLAAGIVLVVSWFLVSTYWLYDGTALQWLTPMLVQPLQVEVAPAGADPAALPENWLLSAPGEYQDHWARVVVSPSLAAWHDAYLVGLTAMLAAGLAPRRPRRVLALAGLVLAAVSVAMKAAVAP